MQSFECKSRKRVTAVGNGVDLNVMDVRECCQDTSKSIFATNDTVYAYLQIRSLRPKDPKSMGGGSR